MNRIIRLGVDRLRVPHMLDALADASPELAMTLEHPLGDEIRRETMDVHGLTVAVTRGGGALSVSLEIAPPLELQMLADDVEGFATRLVWRDAGPELVTRLNGAHGRRIDGFVALPTILEPYAASTVGRVEREDDDDGMRVVVTVDEAIEAAPLHVMPTPRRRNPPRN